MTTNQKIYGDCEGPLGFPMSSEAATEAEGILKDLPQDCKDLGYQRVFKVADVVQLEEGERADISFVTTDSIDRDNEVMLPGGGKWKQFQKNPVITFAHRYDELPIGKAQWVKRKTTDSQNGWLAKSVYDVKPDEWDGPWLADGVWHLIRGGGLKGKSIGFIPTEMRPPSEKEIVARPEFAGISAVIAKWTVLEYSVAPVPSNPDALVQVAAKAKSEGLAMADVLLDELGIILCDAGIEPEQLQAPIPKKEQIIIPVLSMTEVKKVIRTQTADMIRKMDVPKIIKNTLDKLRGKV